MAFKKNGGQPDRRTDRQIDARMHTHRQTDLRNYPEQTTAANYSTLLSLSTVLEEIKEAASKQKPTDELQHLLTLLLKSEDLCSGMLL